MYKEPRSFHFECNCYHIKSEILNYPEEDTLYFTFWTRGDAGPKFTLWEAFKNIFKLLFKRELFLDEIIVSKEKVKEMAKWMLENCEVE